MFIYFLKMFLTLTDLNGVRRFLRMCGRPGPPEDRCELGRARLKNGWILDGQLCKCSKSICNKAKMKEEFSMKSLLIYLIFFTLIK